MSCSASKAVKIGRNTELMRSTRSSCEPRTSLVFYDLYNSVVGSSARICKSRGLVAHKLRKSFYIIVDFSDDLFFGKLCQIGVMHRMRSDLVPCIYVLNILCVDYMTIIDSV